MLPSDVFHLVLAGHYHGGQIRLPTPWGRMPLKEFHAPYLHGLYETQAARAPRLAWAGDELRAGPVPRAARGDASYARRMSQIDISAGRALPRSTAVSTSAALHFLRNHFPFPRRSRARSSSRARSRRPLRLDLAELQRFEQGRARRGARVRRASPHRARSPPVEGLPWGRARSARRPGAALRSPRVLAQAGPAPAATQVVSRRRRRRRFARAIPLDKARDEATLLALALDGGEIPRRAGGPLRAIVPGTTRSTRSSGCGASRSSSEPFDGHFQADDYCLFGADGVPDGTELNELPVTSLVTATERTRIAGVAWGGEIARVDVQVDDGPWPRRRSATRSARTPSRRGSSRSTSRRAPTRPRARATDTAGNTQPERPLWNARGYANQRVHRVDFDLD